MMRDDPIVSEIRQARKEHARRFHFDLHAICEDLRRQEAESGREYVSPSGESAGKRKALPVSEGDAARR